MRLKIGVVLVITALCLGLVLWDLDLSEAREALAAARWSYAVPMALLYLAAHALRAWRLGLLLGQPVPYKRLFLIVSVGFLAINVIPLRLGELVRPYLLAEREGVPFGRGMAAIVLERLLDMAMLLCMLLGLTLVVELPAAGVVVQGVDVVRAGQRAAGVMVALGSVAGLGVVVVGEPAIALIERLPLGAKIASFARRFREGFLALLARPLNAALALLLSVCIWALTIGAVGVVMAAFPGIPAGIGAAWSTWTITLAGMTALPTPGFFGSYEAFCAAALWLWGVDPDLGRTFALVLHIGQFGFTVVIGGGALLMEGLTLRALIRPRPAEEPGAV